MKYKWCLLAVIIIFSSCTKGNEKLIVENGELELQNDNMVKNPVIKSIIETNYDGIIRPDGEKTYVGTFFVRDNKIHFIYESDAGFFPSLIGYKDEVNAFKILVKSRWIGSDWADNIDGKTPVFYYLIEFFEENMKIKYTCKRLNEIKTEGFIINHGKINDDNVNLRENSSLDSKAINKINSNEIVEVKDIGKDYAEIENMTDYWFEIRYKNVDS